MVLRRMTTTRSSSAKSHESGTKSIVTLLPRHGISLPSAVTMDLVPDSCEFTDDLEKDFVIVQALKAAIDVYKRQASYNPTLQILFL